MGAAKGSRARRGVARLIDIPNVGPSVAGDLRRLGISEPARLAGKDPLVLYRKLARLDGAAHDPCLLDTFMAAVEYMEGGPARKWWEYTERRKRLLARKGPRKDPASLKGK
jgi:hypothetical protein